MSEMLPGMAMSSKPSLSGIKTMTSQFISHRVIATLHLSVKNRIPRLGHAVILAFTLLVIGCASVPKDYARTESRAFTNYLDTSVGQLFEEEAVQHPGESGFKIITRGRQGFNARIAMTELAEKTLDLQYYIWEKDETGWLLAEYVLNAADRGVRVRILVDDITLAGRDAAAASLDAHPNIEVRVFNPFAHRSARLIDYSTDLVRVNHRMHNKIFVMDNAVAIIGGRNIGNHYFNVDAHANFRDLDIAAAGPVVREISNVYDYFWNGDWSVPISALTDRPFTNEDLETVRENTSKLIAAGNYPYLLDQDVDTLRSELLSIRDRFIWAPGQILWDDPAAIEGGMQAGKLVNALEDKLEMLQSELLMEAAYFIIREPGVENVARMHDRGVKMRVLTNSLASNDVLAAHAGYSETRDELIANGMEIYEMRPDARAVKQRNYSAESKTGLHAKAMVFDRESVFIGSFNLDPRSFNINTEAGLYVESPELAEQVAAFMDEGVRPENSYRVLLDDEGDLVWVTEIDGEEVRYDDEPETTFGQRFMSDFFTILPIDEHL
jgi:putative cardiolipin synthase